MFFHSQMTPKNGIGFLLLMENYHQSYTELFSKIPETEAISYSTIVNRFHSEFIYYGDAYRHGLSKNGVTAEQVVPSCVPLQLKWAHENRVRLSSSRSSRGPFRSLLGFQKKPPLADEVGMTIAFEQIRRLRPECLWVFSGVPVAQEMIEQWRRFVKKIILWWSCPLIPNFPYKSFDLILSCIPSMVRRFRQQGMNAEYLAHAFDPRVLKAVFPPSRRTPKVLFAGSISPDHSERRTFLDTLSRSVEINFYGYGIDYFPEDSPVRKTFCPGLWGKDFYSLLASHLIVIHHNIDVAGTEASAKRLFEATGMGTCVVTQHSDDLAALFDPGTEIITYSSVEECAEKIKYLLAQPELAVEIGGRAQNRTLAQHDYDHRIKQLLSLNLVAA